MTRSFFAPRAADAARAIAAFLLSALLGCNDGLAPIEVVEPGPPGLLIEPQLLAFTCVAPGCDETLTATVSIEGERSIAIKRVVLSDPERTDFSVETSRPPPFVLEPDEGLTVTVRHRPSGDIRLEDIELLLSYTDGSGAEDDPDRLTPGELAVPLVRRRVGEPRLAASPAEVFFGAVPPSSEGTVTLHLRNDGVGNAGLLLAEATTDSPEQVRIENLPPRALLPGETWPMQVIFRPTGTQVVRGFITLSSVGARAPLMIPFLGTSVDAPTIDVSVGTLEFGDIAKDESAELELVIRNNGAADLVVSSLGIEPNLTVGDIELVGPGVGGSDTIAPLSSADVRVHFDATRGGPIDHRLVISTNDPERPRVEVPLRGMVIEPRLQVSPVAIDFGTVPRGWTVTRLVEIRNIGYGDLTVTNISMLIGSSDLFTLRSVPSLPARLGRNERLGLEIEFRSESEASFGATLSVNTDLVEQPFGEVVLFGSGTSCEAGCPIANGTPSCTSGVCAIGECDPGYYDTDGRAATGCECAEINTDPGAFCADAEYLGQIDDDGSRAQWTGQIAEADDRDIIRFFAYDEAGFFTDAWNVRVRLESTDPGIRFCIYRHNTDEHLSACFFENEGCPEDRQYSKDGSFGRDDSADYILRVFRDPSSAPTCTPYTVYVQNG